MEFKVKVEELRKRKLFIATPMYGGMNHGSYTRSMCDLTSICTRYGIEMRSYFLFNESLITRARNYCADEFLRSGYSHLMFIDSDIGFDPNDVIALLALQSDESDFDIISGPYPKKCITWEKIALAVNKGAADENPNNLENFVGDFVFNPVVPDGQSTYNIKLDRPAEVLEAGTGFMMIKRKTFETFEKAYPHLRYKPDHIRTEHFDGSRYITAYFETVIDRGVGLEAKAMELLSDLANDKITDKEAHTRAKYLIKSSSKASERYLSEDYMFCQYVRNMGGKVWMCPWMHLSHTGMYVFNGRLDSLASVGASATADPKALGKTKKKKKQKQLKRK